MADLQREGRVDQLRGRIRSTWGTVADEDIARSRGNRETLVGTIKEKTGEAAEAVREKLNKLLGDDDRKGAQSA